MRMDLSVQSLRGKYCHLPFPITVIPPHPTIVLCLVRLRPTIVSRLRHVKPLFSEQVHFRSDIVSAQRFRRCGPTGHSLYVAIVACPPITPFQSYVSDTHHSTWPYAWSMLPFLWSPDQCHLHSYHCCSSYISTKSDPDPYIRLPVSVARPQFVMD